MTEPYVSAIIATRNDDHGGDMRRRVRCCVHGMLEQARRHRLALEVILVEWNPPEGAEGISTIFEWAPATTASVRVVTVPGDLHRQYPNADQVPLNLMGAWNVGIRRARAPFVLCTSADVLLSDGLATFLSERALREDCFYHIDRSDVDPGVLSMDGLDSQLEFCRTHVLRIAERMRPEFPKRYHIPDLRLSAPGDFTLMARRRFLDLGGYPECYAIAVGVDILFCYLAAKAGVQEVLLEPPRYLYHIDHRSSWERPRHGVEKAMYERTRLRDVLPRSIRKALAPIARTLFPSRRSRWDSLGVPYLSYEDLERILIALYEGKRALPANDRNWGLAAEDLSDVKVV